VSNVRHPPMEIHQSSAQLIENCPRLFKAKVIDGLDDSNRWSRIGSACHVVAQRLNAAETDAWGDPPGGGLPSLARAVLDEQVDAGAIDKSEREECEAVLVHAFTRKMQFGFGPGWEVWNELTWRMREDFTHIPHGVTEPAAYSGTWDRLQRHPEFGVSIVDYKTSAAAMTGTELSQDFQARTYALAAMTLFPDVRTVTLMWGYLRVGRWARAVFDRDGTWMGQTKARLIAARARVAAHLELDQWPETLGLGCKYCPLADECATFVTAVRAPYPPADALSVEQQAARVVALSRHLQTLERSVRAYARSHGPIPLGGACIGYKPVEKLEPAVSYEETLAELRTIGMTPAQEIEWFRFVREADFPGRVRSALWELNPATAKGWMQELLSPYTGSKWGIFEPEPPGAMPESAFDEEDMDA